MSERSLLLGFYPDRSSADAALRELKRRGFRRVALLHRTPDGDDVQTVSRYGRRRLVWPSGAALTGLIIGILADLLLVIPENGLVTAALLLVPTVAGLVAGALLAQRYRITFRDADLANPDRWLVPDETVLHLQGSTDDLAGALGTLRGVGEVSPSIFAVQSECGYEAGDEPVPVVPLSVGQLEEHARRLAADHRVGVGTGHDEPLVSRLGHSEEVIAEVHDRLAAASHLEQSISPAAEWLLDNSYIVQEHINDVRTNLPEPFYHELPVLVDVGQQARHDGAHEGKPRAYALAEDLVRHTDGKIEQHVITAFLDAYQQVAPLEIGELWAMPLMIRMAIIERLRRLAEQVDRRLRERESGDFWANRLLTAARRDPDRLFVVLAELARVQRQPSAYFASQLAIHLFDEEAALIPIQSWFERTLHNPLADTILWDQGREAGTQVSIGNAITTLRQLSRLDWRNVFERLSHVERALRDDPAGVYLSMDFDTRSRYRDAVEEIARGSAVPEVEVARQAVALADAFPDGGPNSLQGRHVGTYLIDSGRPNLVAQLGGRETRRHRILRRVYAHHTALYLGAIAVSTTVLVLPVPAAARWSDVPLLAGVAVTLIALLPASQVAIQIVNYVVTRLLPPRVMVKMSFEASGIPDAYRTLVVVPMLLVDEKTLREEVEKLEIRYLANPDANLQFGLLADYRDSDVPHEDDDDELLRKGIAEIEELNRRHGANRFYLFVRDRVWCETEQRHIGWERKRGKLEELNALIVGEPVRRGAEIVRVGDPGQLINIRFVITLDSDTQLPRDSARRLVETLAHPLNQPWQRRAEAGAVGTATIVQPRVSTSLPSAVATPFSRLFTDPVGTDPYTRAVSDVYQDLSGEGSYIGKGIYDPRTFHSALGGRFREGTLLSHDLIEGAHLRTALATDIELFDEFPPNYTTYTRRQHRWIRGDWQIAEWCLPRVPATDCETMRNTLSILNRWKIFDNLRRSLAPAGVVAFLVVSWLLHPALGAIAGALVAVLMLFHPTAQLATDAMTAGSRNVHWPQLRHSVGRSVAETALLVHQAALALDATARVLYRRLVSRRRLLEWTTAQVASWTTGGHAAAFLLHMSLVSLFAGATALFLWLFQPTSLIPAAPYLVLWFISPYVAWRLNAKPGRESVQATVPDDDLLMLRRVARRTWRYYDDLVGPDTNWLPPDNFQVSHTSEIAMRTSPTNIGMWLLSVLGANDFGYTTAADTLARIGFTFDTLARLEVHDGHLLNWYDIGDLTPLSPRYVSTVDSGNLLGCLWALEQGLVEMADRPLLERQPLDGLADTVGVLREALTAAGLLATRRASVDELGEQLRVPEGECAPAIDVVRRLRQAVGPAASLSRELREEAEGSESAYWAGQIERQLGLWLNAVDADLPWLEAVADAPHDCLARLDADERAAVDRVLAELPSCRALASGDVPAVCALLAACDEEADRGPTAQEWRELLETSFDQSRQAAAQRIERVEALNRFGRELADRMGMRFLFDTERRLFSIGFNVDDQRLDGSYYDLLASEARLASFIAIARGEVPTEHWLAMGRPLGEVNGRRALLSWSGTMFEYLMPLLLQHSIENSLLDMAARQAVLAQIDYANSFDVPWGISESAYGDLDANKTYQYKAFGVPGLGFKRGLTEDLVVAPYATLLALAVDPAAAVRNLARLADLGMYDEYGFYEAMDFNRRSQRGGDRGVLVRAYMAHHQGMGFLAIDNLVFDGVMQRRFHADPRVKATEPLLYERVPLSRPLHHLSTREQPPLRAGMAEFAPSASKFETPHTDSPKSQLLSNGRYALMVTGAGGGYSRWDDIEITRWRSDPTCDNWGTFCYIRDVDRDHVWSNTYHPARSEADSYRVQFHVDRGEIRRRDHGIDTETQVIVSPEGDAEIRCITLVNRMARTRNVEVTTYTELALAPHRADRQHPAFNKLFVETEADQHRGALLAYRRPRDPDDRPIFVAQRLTPTVDPEASFEFETDRARFIGRGRSIERPVALHQRLSNTAGLVLDPILSLRRALVLKPGQRVTFSLVMVAADTRETVLELLDNYGDAHAIDRAMEVAWARSQLELRQLRVQPDEARRFLQLASYMLYPNARLRPAADRLEQNRRGQSGLWAHGISGDLPIAVVTIGEMRDIGVVREMLQGHTYWRRCGLKADLLILNEASGGYERPLRDQLARLVHAYSIYTDVDQPGGVFLRDVDQIPDEDVTLMLSVARVVLVAARGPLAQQLGVPGEVPEAPTLTSTRRAREEPSSPLPHVELLHTNGLGGFTLDGREYVVEIDGENTTPAPWINVLANPEFGALVSESGSGFTWYGNSQRNRLTPWSNDPVSDPPGEAIYIRDEESGRFWTPTPLPIREAEGYRVRHGAGYSVFEHNSHAIEQTLTVFVPIDDDGGEPVRIQRLVLRNDSRKSRRLSVTFYADPVLGEDRETSMAHVITHWDDTARLMLARNRYNDDYGDRVVFATLYPAPTAHSGHRTSFIGRNGSLADPAAMGHVELQGRCGAGLDPCVALQVVVELEPGQRAEVTALIGEASTVEEARTLTRKYRENLAVEMALEQTRAWWDRCLSTIEVEVPEPSANLLLNRWLLYQTLACRMMARSGFYQSGGAYGFRDQLQDVMALLHAAPELARAHIMSAARRQFRAGDVQHWWHPPSGAGVRTRISDDLLWLPYVVATYVQTTGDATILSESLPFIEARHLDDAEHEAYLVPSESLEHASLYEHCRRAIEKGATSGAHGLPLIGTGDWNDGLNRVGMHGKGESVWLAWFLVDTLNRFAEVAVLRGEPDDAAAYHDLAARYAEAVEENAWDGRWYRRATFDDGMPIGSENSVEAKIDSLPQSWAWLSGAADRDRAALALESAWEHLVLPEDRLSLLFTPPFDKWEKNPGYVKGYPPGVRENGGQYTHGAVWLAMALARSGDGGRAVDLLQILNPIENALDAESVQRYQVEPYVVAADVYRLPGRIGRGGWTWYTGAAGWMYRAWIEEVLGLRIRGDVMTVAPVLPADWDGFKARYRHGAAIYEITVENPDGVESGVVAIELDGRRLEVPEIPLESGAIKHKVAVRMG